VDVDFFLVDVNGWGEVWGLNLMLARKRRWFGTEGKTYCDLVSILQTRLTRTSFLPKVHVQITMEDTVRLCRVQVPDKLAVSQRSGGRHHLTHQSISRSVTSLKSTTTTSSTTPPTPKKETKKDKLTP
jgi:hypothetical protein